MNRVKIAAGLRRMVLGQAIVLMCSGVVGAGAPAPPPITGTGPHQPQHQVANLGDLRFENGTVVKDLDTLFNREAALFARATIPNATYVEIDSAFGHAACCGFDAEATKIMGREIASFLSKLW